MATKKNIVMNDYMQKIMDAKQSSDVILDNYNYMNWLEEYMKGRKRAYDDDYVYEENPDEIDYNNIMKFEALFTKVESYAKKNYISISQDDYKVYYKIKYNNIAYHLGCIYGQGMAYFVDRIDLANLNDYIDVKDIVNDTVLDYVSSYKERLENLKIDILNAYADGIDLEFLGEAIDESINKIKESKEKNRRLKK